MKIVLAMKERDGDRDDDEGIEGMKRKEVRPETMMGNCSGWKK